MAAIAASLTFSGVSKSGSPAARPMTSLPAAFSARALLVMAMVRDGEIRSSRSAMSFMVWGLRSGEGAGTYRPPPLASPRASATPAIPPENDGRQPQEQPRQDQDDGGQHVDLRRQPDPELGEDQH